MQIDLSCKNLIDFDCTVFSTDDEREVLGSIDQLNISFNSISSLCGLMWLSKLTVLDVSHNNIADLRGLPLSVRRLNASFNLLTCLKGLSPLSHLEVLVASHNQITNMEGVPVAVRSVDVSSNRLVSLSGLERCTALEELRLRQNMIPRVEELAALRPLRSLRTLTLAENPATVSQRRIAAVHALLPPNLRVVDLPPAPETTQQSSAVFSLGSVMRGGVSPNVSSLNTTTARDVTSPFGRSSLSAVGMNKDESTTSVVPRGAANSCKETNTAHGQRQEESLGADVSAPGVCTQQATESMLEHLQSEFDACRRRCLLYEEENANLRRQVQRLRKSNRHQEQMNAMLLEKNRELQVKLAGNKKNSPIRQEEDALAPLNTENNIANGSGDQAQNLPGHQRVKFFQKNNEELEKQNLRVNIDCRREELLLGGNLSLGEKVKRCHQARSLASLLMSFVSKAATKPSLSNNSLPASDCTNNGRRNEENIEAGRFGTNNKGQKRSVSFGGFAYYSPPSWPT